MKNIDPILVKSSSSIREVLERINASHKQIALVVDGERKLLGSVTDGDVRRGILRGVGLEDPVSQVMNRNPVTTLTTDSRLEAKSLMHTLNLRHIPVVDPAGILVAVVSQEDDHTSYRHDNLVVLMAGGLGTRLKPLTDDCPKPLLKVGGKPILEHILLHLLSFGFHRFAISVNYRAEMIKNHFGDGSRWEASIVYLEERQRMGTAGALSLIEPDMHAGHPVIVMNGDLLTSARFDHLLDFHKDHGFAATMCAREYEQQVPYGVLQMDGNRIAGIVEKPVERHLINAGIYVINSDELKRVPQDTFFDMTSLFDDLIASGSPVAAYPVQDQWIDIGRHQDLQRARDEHIELQG